MSALDRLLLGKSAESDPSGEPPKSEFLVQLFQKMVKGVKAANSLPSSDDYKCGLLSLCSYWASHFCLILPSFLCVDCRYYESFPAFEAARSELASSLLTVMNRLCDKIQVSHPARNPAQASQADTITRLDLLEDDLDRFNVL